jgi:serine/threonine protein kinase/tetratricopeptide (TPR) repeat protein
VIGKTISHYKILEELGRGGMGVVYKALDTKLQRHVAIKVLPAHLSADREAKTRFTREARAASALEHPHICHIHEIGETDDGHLFMVMPCYEGETLAGRLDRGPLEVGEALDITCQIASALSRAHGKGIIHRDIKPGNVMLTDGERQAKLMDFGLAKRLDATKVTRTGTALGTVAYMSPEQAMGKQTDHRADIWALGVVLYEMLSGRQPFRGEYEPAVLYAVMNEEPEPISSSNKAVPPGVERIAERALTKDVEKRYQTIDELLRDIEAERDRIELGVKERRFIKLRKRTRNRILRVGLPVLLLAAAVFVLLVVQPFELEIRTRTKEAIAQENSMAIMFFENMVDPDDSLTAEMVTSLLYTDLGSSEYINVMSEQQKYDILRQLGKEGPGGMDRGLAVEVAKQAGMNWVLTGKIMSLEPQIVLTSEISHITSGEARQQQVRSFGREDLFAVVDKLTKAVREDLILPDEAIDDVDHVLADITTHSMDAYRYYVEGMDYLHKAYGTQAKESFEKSLEFDSTFAMAYLRLASSGVPTMSKEKKRMIEKALQYSEKTTAKERMYIESQHASLVGDKEGAIRGYESIIEKYPYEFEAYHRLGFLNSSFGRIGLAIENIEKSIDINPLYKPAYDALAFLYRDIGDIEKSIWALNELISIAPDEPNAYDTRGYLYAYSGDLDRAIESFERALELNPDFGSSLLGLGHMHMFKEDFANAEKYYQMLISSDDSGNRALGRLFLPSVSIYKGKIDEAIGLYERGISENQRDGFKGGQSTAWKYYNRSLLYLEKGDHERALADARFYIEECIRISATEDIYFDDPIVMLLAHNGEISEAEEWLDSLHDKIRGSASQDRGWYWLASGWLEMEKGNVDSACVHFERAHEIQKWFIFEYSLALAYLESGRFGEAVQAFESTLNRCDAIRASYALYAVKTYYYLGIAYEKSGSDARAMEQYERFLEIWKDADPDLEALRDARERLARLKAT